jgi:precorrin-6B methylase 2
MSVRIVRRNDTLTHNTEMRPVNTTNADAAGSAGEQPATIPNAVRMIQMLSGFQVSQALYVVAKLGVATALLDGPRSIEYLATATQTDGDALRRLVRFLATFGVFRRMDEDTIEITEVGATLAEGPADSVRAGALYWMETHYAPFGDLLHTARTGAPAATRHYGMQFWEWVSTKPDILEIQNRAFANVTAVLRTGMFDSYRLPAGNTIADIGGSDGALLSQLLVHDPNRRGIVLDRPEVVQAAHKVLATNGLADRIEVVAGDFFDAVPTADVYVLSYILHDWDDASCTRLLRTVAKSAPPGARLVLIETVIPPGDAPHFGKAIDLNMLVMLGGRERTAAEYEALLAAGGFTLDRIVPSPTPFSFIEASVR